MQLLVEEELVGLDDGVESGPIAVNLPDVCLHDQWDVTEVIPELISPDKAPCNPHSVLGPQAVQV